jgi:hypothetical protein
MAKQTKDKRAIRSHLLIALFSFVCFVIVLSVLWITSSDCSFVLCLFCHCFLCSLNYSFWLLFCPLSVLSLFCLFFELHLLIALLSLVCFVIVLSVLWITVSDCSFVPCLFCHCIVCPLNYSFWLLFCPLSVLSKTRDKRAIRRCNTKNRQNNDKTDKGQKSNQKL